MAKRSRSASRRKSTSRSAKKGNGSLLPWLAAGAVAAGGMWYYDHAGSSHSNPLKELAHQAEGVMKQGSSEKEGRSNTVASRQATTPLRETSPTLPKPPEAIPVAAVRPIIPSSAVSRPSEPEGSPTGRSSEGNASFGYCGQGEHINCVADGATFWYKGEKIVMSDIASPRIDAARCDAERKAGFAAKARLLQLLNAGRFNISQETSGRLVSRAGRSLGEALVSEGLARRPGSGSWCA